MNNAFRERTTLHLEGGLTWTKYSAARAGYLSAQSLSWLLAVQLKVRSEADALELEAALEPQQRRTFHEALAVLDRDALWKELGLPPREQLQFTAPVQPPARRLPPLAVAETPRHGPYDRIAFRMRGRSSPGIIFICALVGVGVSAAVGNLVPMFLFPAVYVAWVKLMPQYICAGSNCDAALLEHEHACRRCGATIVGEIERLRDRHEAEQRWRAEHGEPSPDDDDELTRLALEKR